MRRVSGDIYEVFAAKVRGAVHPRLTRRDFLGQRDHTRPLGQSSLKWRHYKIAPSWSMRAVFSKCGSVRISSSTSDSTAHCEASSKASSRYSVRCRCAKGAGPPGKSAARSRFASSNIEAIPSCRGDETRRMQASWRNELSGLNGLRKRC